MAKQLEEQHEAKNGSCGTNLRIGGSDRVCPQRFRCQLIRYHWSIAAIGGDVGTRFAHRYLRWSDQ